jgi:hypothetical protein
MNFWHVGLWHNLQILNFNQYKTCVTSIFIRQIIYWFKSRGLFFNIVSKDKSFHWEQVNDKYGTDGRKKPICNKLMGETPFETLSMRISPNWTKWGKHSQIEHACGIFSPIWENKSYKIFFSQGIFHGTADRGENPTEIPWGFMFYTLLTSLFCMF